MLERPRRRLSAAEAVKFKFKIIYSVTDGDAAGAAGAAPQRRGGCLVQNIFYAAEESAAAASQRRAGRLSNSVLKLVYPVY